MPASSGSALQIDAPPSALPTPSARPQRGGGPPAWPWLAGLLVLAGFLLRIYRIDYQSVWWDEGFSRHLASLDIPAMVWFASANDTHPLGYHLALHWWMPVAGDSELALRYLSLIPGVLCLPLIYRLGDRFGGPLVGLVALALLAIAPFHVAYSQEARMYSQVAFFALAGTWALVRATERGRRRNWVIFGLLLGLGLQTHYSIALVAAGQVIWLGARALSGPRSLARPLILGGALGAVTAGLVFLPWLPLGLRQVVGFESPVTEPISLGLALLRFGRYLFGGPLFEGDQPDSVWIPLAALAGLVALALVLVLALRSDRRTRWALFLAPTLALVPLAAYAPILARKPMFHPRYLLVLLPFVLLVFALAAADRRLPLRWPRLILLVPVLALSGIGLTAYYFDPVAQKDQNREMVAYIEEQAARRGVEPVALVDTSAFSIDYYVRDRFPAYRLENPTHQEVVDAFRAAAARSPYIYHITWFKTGSDRRLLTPFLFHRYGEPVSTRQFFGGTITEYRLLRPPDGDELARLAPADALFGRTLRLTGRASGAGGDGRIVPGGSLWAVLRWRLEAPATADYRVGLRLVDAAGHEYGTSDRTLIAGEQRYTSNWRVGEEELSFFSLEIDPGAPPGDYTLTAAVYDRRDPGQSLEHDQPGDPTHHHLPIATVTIERPSAPADPSRLPELRGEPKDLGPLRWLGYGAFAPPSRPGDRVEVPVYWQATAPVPEPALAGLELRGAGGSVRLAEPGPIGAATYPATEWPPGTIQRTYLTGRLPADLAAGEYTLQARVNLGGREETIDLGAPLAVQPTERNQVIPPHDRPLDQPFGPAITLLGVSMALGGERLDPLGTIQPGQTLSTNLIWQAKDTVDVDYTVFVQLLDPSGKLIAQHDAPPAAGAWPTSTWLPGQVIEDRHDLRLPETLTPGTYRLIAGLYDPRTGRRLPPTGRAEDYVVLAELNGP